MALQKLDNGAEAQRAFAIKTRAKELLGSGSTIKEAIQTSLNEYTRSANRVKGSGRKVRV
jgi:hypothetical protein